MTDAICCVETCDRPSIKRAYCQAHYLRWWRHGDANTGGPIRLAWRDDKEQDFAERIAARINRTPTCWEWTGYITVGGYGSTVDYTGKSHLAHRLTYEEVNGPIPDGLVLDHLCRNRACVNPAHLEAVTLRENLERGQIYDIKMGRRTQCVNGHEYTAENTYTSPKGKTRCRQCVLDRHERDKATRQNHRSQSI